MNLVYLISPDFVKVYTTYMNDNIDNDLLDLGIIESQDIELQSILGSKLYNSILEKASGDTLTGDYLSLVDDYCVKVVLYYTIKRSITRLLYKFNNKNIGIKSSDNTTPIDFSAFNFLKESVSQDAEFYSQRLINHLNEDGASLYSEYNTESGGDEIDPNMDTLYTTGLDLSSNSYKNLRNCRNKWLSND